MGPSKPVECRQPLDDLGLDSLMAVELSNALSKVTGCHQTPQKDGFRISTENLDRQWLMLESCLSWWWLKCGLSSKLAQLKKLFPFRMK
jgi:hypothetical protein